MKLNINAYHFNAKTDYLPYYKKYNLEVDENSNLASILPLIKEQNRDYNYQNKNLFFRINSYVTDGNISIKDIVDRFGKELTIEPVLEHRCFNDLEINDEDFFNSFKLLEPYCNKDDKNFYMSLYGLHYASSTFEYNKEYIGDAILVLASRLIFNNNPKKDEILKAITVDNGLWDAEYENGMLDFVDYTDTFKLLKDLAGSPKDKNKVNRLFTRKYKEIPLSSDSNIAVAFYYGINNNDSFELSQETLNNGYQEIKFKHSNKSCGIDLLETNEKLAIKKAGRVLSDAYDSGAEILLAEKKYIDYFKNNIGAIKRVINREILINLEDVNSFGLES